MELLEPTYRRGWERKILPTRWALVKYSGDLFKNLSISFCRLVNWNNGTVAWNQTHLYAKKDTTQKNQRVQDAGEYG